MAPKNETTNGENEKEIETEKEEEKQSEMSVSGSGSWGIAGGEGKGKNSAYALPLSFVDKYETFSSSAGTSTDGFILFLFIYFCFVLFCFVLFILFSLLIDNFYFFQFLGASPRQHRNLASLSQLFNSFSFPFCFLSCTPSHFSPFSPFSLSLPFRIRRSKSFQQTYR